MPPVTRPRLLAGAATTLVLLGTGLAPTALAHDHLVAASPAEDATLPVAPPRVVLQFDQKVLARGAQITISTPEGRTMTRQATVSGQSVSAPFGGTSVGAYHVTWRVTSADGHPVSGDLDFTVRGGAAATTPSANSTLSGPTTPTTNEPGDNEPALVIGGFTALTAAVVGAWFALRRRVSDDPR